jgi:hypothetical protein
MKEVKKMKKIEVCISGGFHNRDFNYFMIPAECLMLDGSLDITYISEKQRAALDNLYCGVSGCTCGGISRCLITFTSNKK